MSSVALPAPTPLAGRNQPVDWMFAFKFNYGSFPGCTDEGKVPAPGTPGIFGGTVQPYPHGHSQQYVFATSAHPTLVKGQGCLGATLDDPLGATFAQVYNRPGYNYLLWNDQFYGQPVPTLLGPWGHSKGLLAWNDQGQGMVLQVSTPSWPGSGSRADPRQTGNTLGAIGDDDDIEVSQHFFALKLSPADLVTVLAALNNASVVTDVRQPSIVRNGGPAAVQALVTTLGIPESERRETTPSPPTIPGPPSCTIARLSTGVQIISKPNALHLPPWQVVSSLLGSRALRVASWWEEPAVFTTPRGAEIQGWPATLAQPGAVAIATSGTWQGKTLGLTGGAGANHNHAKLGVTTDAGAPLSIFGDMNQMGAVRGQMDISQNARGGTFYVLQQREMWSSLTQLLKGDTAPESAAAMPAQRKPARPKRAGSRPAKKSGKQPARKPRPAKKSRKKTARKPKPAKKKPTRTPRGKRSRG